MTSEKGKNGETRQALTPAFGGLFPPAGTWDKMGHLGRALSQAVTCADGPEPWLGLHSVTIRGIRPVSFIDDYGDVKYTSGMPRYPMERPQCEICKARSCGNCDNGFIWLQHLSRLATCPGCRGAGSPPSFFEFDHCHVHGWVRGVVCQSCNQVLRGIDEGWRPAEASYAEHRAKCPDCGGRRPRLPQESRVPKPPGPCWNCSSGFVWLGTLARMVKCLICDGTGTLAGKEHAP